MVCHVLSSSSIHFCEVVLSIGVGKVVTLVRVWSW